MIFPLLHEAVHAVRDEYRVNDGFDEDEELFCYMVANYIQFPDEYVIMVYNVIIGELLGIESLMDAKAVKDELMRLKRTDS